MRKFGGKKNFTMSKKLVQKVKDANDYNKSIIILTLKTIHHYIYKRVINKANSYH